MPLSQETQILNGATNEFKTKAIDGNSTANRSAGLNGNAKVNGNAATSGKDQVHDLAFIATRLHVERSERAFGSRAVSLVDLPAGAVFAKITTATPATKAYSSVQISEMAHIELNSELVFVNHSCDPSLVFDMGRFEVRVGDGRDLKKGDELTFFYPSSEWDMAQPFDCNCGSVKCKSVIDGSRKMDEAIVREYWLNGHIERMLDARDARKNGTNGANGANEHGNGVV